MLTLGSKQKNNADSALGYLADHWTLSYSLRWSDLWPLNVTPLIDHDTDIEI